MRFRVVGGPLVSTIDMEATATDRFSSIIEKLQNATGVTTSLEAYDLYTTKHSSLTGELVTDAHPLRLSDTPATISLHQKENDPHVLVLVQRGTHSEPISAQQLLSGAPTTEADDGSRESAVAVSPSSSGVVSPEAAGKYQSRIRAMFLKYDRSQRDQLEETLDRHGGDPERVLKSLVEKYGPEPAPGEVDTLPTDAGASTTNTGALEDGSASDNEPRYHGGLVDIDFVYESGKLNSAPYPLKSRAVQRGESSPQGLGVHAPEVFAAYVSGAETGVATGDGSPRALRVRPQDRLELASGVEAPTHSGVGLPVADKRPTGPMELLSTVAKTGESPIASASSAASPSVNGSRGESVSGGGRYRERLVALYHTYNPRKLHTVEGTLRRFVGKEETAIQQLVRRYGPEPAPLTTEEAFVLLACAGAGGGATSTSAKTTPTTANLPGAGASSTNCSHTTESAEPPNQKSNDARERISEILATHEPDKLDKVDRLLEMYKGREEEVVSKLEMRYSTHRGARTNVEPTLKTSNDVAHLMDSRPVVSTASQVSVVSTTTQGLPTTSTAAPINPVPSSESRSPTMTAHLQTNVSLAKALHATDSLRVSTMTPVSSSLLRSFRDGTGTASLATVEITKPPSPSRSAPAVAATPQMMGIDDVLPPVPSPDVVKRTATLLSQQGVSLGQAASAAEHHRLIKPVDASSTLAGSLGVVQQTLQSSKSAQGHTLSNETQVAAQALLASLRHCLESRTMQAQSNEERQLVDTLTVLWATRQELHVINDSPQLAHALHQAAHLIGQLDSILAVIRTQAGQIKELKMLYEDMLTRTDTAGCGTDTLSTPGGHVDPLNNSRGAAAQNRKRTPMGKAEARASQSTPRRMHSPVEESKDAQIVKLQQELAKTRILLLMSRESKEKVSVQLQRFRERETLTAQENLHRTGKSPRCSTPSLAQPRNRPEKVACSSNPSLLSPSPRPRLRALTPPGAFSYTPAQRTPRRQWTSQVKGGGHFLSSIRTPNGPAADEACSNISGNSCSPWPSSRYVMETSNVASGSCPHCITPLTMCCSQRNGPASERAAFCFSCRRYFTFGELRVLSARELIEQL